MTAEELERIELPGKATELGSRTDVAFVSAGVRLVFVIDPVGPEARTYRADGGQIVVGADGLLDGGDALLDLSCRLVDCLD